MGQALACSLVYLFSVLHCQTCQETTLSKLPALGFPSPYDQLKELWGDWRIGGGKRPGYFHPQVSLLRLASLPWLLCGSSFWRWPRSLRFAGTTFSLCSSHLRITIFFFHHWSLACLSLPLWLLCFPIIHATNSYIEFLLFETLGEISILWLETHWYTNQREKEWRK